MTRETLLLIAFQSGALFLALWGIFRLVPSIPAGAKAWLWRLAFLKPLLSLLPFAVVTLRVLPAPEPGSGFNPVFEFAPMAAPLPLDLGPSSPSALSLAPVEPAGSIIDPLLIAWYFGVFAVACYSLWGMRRSLRLAHEAEPVENSELVDALHELLGKAGVHRQVQLLSSSKVRSAMLVGGKNYAVVLPTEIVNQGSLVDLRMMVAHEVAHIARRDLMWFGLTTVVQSLFFFNPMVWVAARCSRLDHESATDRHAMILAGVPVKTYAEMLLRATVVARPTLAPGSLPVAASYRTIHRRLQAMKHFNSKPTFWRRTAIAALALLTLSLLPAYELAAAAWPGGQFPEDLAVDEPLAVVAQASTTVRAAKAQSAPVAKAQASGKTYGTLPLKAVKGKQGKVRYYVWTKKGYVEVNAKDVQSPMVIGRTLGRTVGVKGGEVGVIAAAGEPVMAAPARQGTVQVVMPAIAPQIASAKPVQGTTKALNPIRAVAAPMSPVKATAATSPSTPLIRTTLEAPKITASRSMIVATLPAVLRTSVTTTDPLTGRVRNLELAKTNLTVAPTAGTVALQRDPLKLSSVPAIVVDKPAKLPDPILAPEKVSTVIAEGWKAPTVASTRSLIAPLQEKPSTARSLYSTGPVRSLLAKPAQAKRYTVVYAGANKLTIIDANGATKVYELEPGKAYELEGGTLWSIKSQKPSAEHKATSLVYHHYPVPKTSRQRLESSKWSSQFRYIITTKAGNGICRYSIDKDGNLKPAIVDKDKDKDKEE